MTPQIIQTLPSGPQKVMYEIKVMEVQLLKKVIQETKVTEVVLSEQVVISIQEHLNQDITEVHLYCQRYLV